MSNPSQSRVAGPVLAGVAVLGAFIVYYGVSSTSGTHRVDEKPEAMSQDLAGKFVSWSDSVWSQTQNRDQLVFLLVSDSSSPLAMELESQMHEISELQAQFAEQVTPIGVSRRTRPDLAERYAQHQVPVALLLLPSGEALSVLQGECGRWPAQITQADRFRRDHRDEISARVEKFWDVAQPRTPSADSVSLSAESLLIRVDQEVLSYIDSMLSAPATSDEIWRVDIGSYLRLRARSESPKASASARRLLERLMSARNAAWPDDLDLLSHRLPAAGIAQLALEPFVLTNLSPADRERAALVLTWMGGRTEPFTASETAAMRRLEILMGEEPEIKYPGRWLGGDRPGTGSLPHIPGDPAGLDGFLTDGLAWLECLIESRNPARVIVAQTLADSIWSRLWSEEGGCFRDKPIRTSAIRELEVFPRAQLGRAAMSYLRLSERPGQSVMRSRAHRCLRAFQPYLEASGGAAAYFGSALMLNSSTKSSSVVNSGT